MSGEDPATHLPTICEGRVAEGIGLGVIAHAACEAARRHAPSFSHARHLIPASKAELRDTPFPADLANPVVCLPVLLSLARRVVGVGYPKPCLPAPAAPASRLTLALTLMPPSLSPPASLVRSARRVT